MSQSEIWDALLIAGDALQDGRIDYCESALQALADDGAWDFELLDYPRKIVERCKANAMSPIAARLCDLGVPYEAPSPYDNLVAETENVRAAYRFAEAVGAPDEIPMRCARWIGQAHQMLNPGYDGIEVRVRSWANVYTPHTWAVMEVA